jgi:L-aspartate oxidase
MGKTKHPNVFLDLTHLPPELIKERFPHIGDVCAEFGLDIAHDLIPVRPGAHYMVGGVTVDQHARTTLPGLWAAGEVTSSGLHGANRLASNSLLEGVVYGRLAGRGAAIDAVEIPDQYRALPLESDWPTVSVDDKDQLDLKDLRNSLTSEMWRKVGIQRDDADLNEAGQNVEFWNRYVASREFASPEGWELQNMMLAAKLMIAAARMRTESRGVHFRRDYPQTDEAQSRHITMVARREDA